MKKFFKFIGVLLAFFSAILGALTVFDRISNKNRIKEEYIDCSDKD